MKQASAADKPTPRDGNKSPCNNAFGSLLSALDDKNRLDKE
jgi:hypothetical protein